MKRLSLILALIVLVWGIVSCATPVVEESVRYNLTVSSTEGGSVSAPGEGTFAYDEGMVVPLAAAPANGYRFVNWAGDVDTIANVGAAVTAITMNDSYSITATFELVPPVRYNLTVSSTAGGSVTTPGEGTFMYDTGTVVSLVAEAEEGYRFVNWTGEVESIADINAASTNITMEGSYPIRANFGLPTYSSLDYFPIAEGHGIKYHVVDNHHDTPCNANVWAVSQYFETGKPDDLDFVFTLVNEGAKGDYYCPCSLGGQMSLDCDDKNCTRLYAGYPVGNQGHFYRNFGLLRTFSSGDEWTLGSRKYTVERMGQQTIGSVEFYDCIKITIDNSLHESQYQRGTGYFILARDVGIVKLIFNRTDGTDVSYVYAEHRQLSRHTISGTIHRQGVPVEGLVVGISNGNWGISSVTDSNGAFSVQAYGPDIVLRMWYDKDNDDICDFDDPGYPKEFCVNNVSSDVVGLVVDVSTL